MHSFSLNIFLVEELMHFIFEIPIIKIIVLMIGIGVSPDKSAKSLVVSTVHKHKLL